MFGLEHLSLAFTTNGKLCQRLYSPSNNQSQINAWVACMEKAKQPIHEGRVALAGLMVVTVVGAMFLIRKTAT